ncbi:MC026L [Molluscum contagiosum virus subtype 1]|uniref:MC026L n=4 Tax=Molluscum contagiosum virus TaxID=10279 RepID=Q98194_MCV1|nr:MC026L [Molluscum contagiosum virus subtype 1]AZT86341.1 MC026L [Molluscum contagiosum virus]AAC55154.1 MC026L [Molluscum contagiosum virus subtype 1]AQY16771.1 MC026 [Molluscum contagiosum virus subtype 1]AQY16950.1 MC026 [Molluscum contagiosum virus subtype 1]AQY17130.1 MC026 [Molluscum contagiosum virus subtype 1]
MNLRLLYWRPVVQWQVRNCDNICYICRRGLGKGCLRPQCEIDCAFCLPVCGHGYHEHCLPPRTEVCFVCRQKLIFYSFNIRKG